MALIESWVRCDLNSAVQVQFLQGNLFSADNQGNLVGVRVFDGSEPASLSGTVSANVIRADNTTVPVAGSIQNGNECYVILPQAAYAVTGVVKIAIKITSSSVITTLAMIISTVYESSTDEVVDPGTIIPSIEMLIAEIEAAVATIPADYSSLWTSLAPAFSTSTAYVAGQYVTYNGGLYRFTTAHAAGSWNSGHVVAVNLGGEITDLKSALLLKTITESAYTLAQNTDFDTVTDVGSYRVNTSVNADTMVNAPVKKTGRLIVMGTFTTGVLYQFYLDSVNDIYWRYKNGTGTWLTWKRMTSYKEMQNETLGLPYSYLTTIADNTNFDTITTAGNYLVASEASAGTMTRIPVKKAGRLEVITNSNTVIYQFYISNVNNIYFRIKTSLGWFEWGQITSKEYVDENTFSLVSSSAISIDDNTDFDSLTTPGNYLVASEASAETMENMPIAKAGRLEVLTTNAGTNLYQIYFSNVNKIYFRIKILSGWVDWSAIMTDGSTDLAFLLQYNRATRVGTSTDLDNLSDPGNYFVGSTPDAKSISNIPVHAPGRLTVMTLMYGIVMQTYDAYVVGDIRRYFRIRNSSSVWQDWWEESRVKRHEELTSFEPDETAPLTQGMCVTDKYVYIATIKKDNSKEIVYRFDKFSFESRGSVAFTGLIRHANGFTWNQDDKKVYCAVGNSTQEIIVFDEELTYVDTITMHLEHITSLSAIAYDPVTKLWAITGAYGINPRVMYVLSELTDNSVVEEFSCPQSFQGIFFLNHCIYGIESGGTLTIYNISGEQVAQAAIKKPVEVDADTVEFENVQIIGKNIIYNFHDHTNGKAYLYYTPMDILIDVPTLLP